MKHLILFCLATLTLFSCCKKPKPGNFKVTLETNVGTQPFAVSTAYADGTGKDFYFNKLKFYLSHVKLIKSDNSEVEIKDAAFFNVDDNNWKSFSAEVDAGTYKGIKFSVGLDPAQNATNPDDYGADEALGPKDDMYWEWLKHRFIVAEGVADTTGNNFLNGNHGLGYHVGTDATYKTATVNGADIVVEEGVEKQITLRLDLLKVFYGTTDTVNMFTEPATQSESGDLPLAIKFAEQFSKAFSY